MKFNPFKALESRKQEEAKLKEYFDDLNLSLEFLKNKKILDIGCHDLKFKNALSRRGSFDLTLVDKEKTQQKTETGIILADAQELPFSDNTFDLIISRASVFILSEDKREVANAIAEAYRVLKVGGEFRFGVGNLNCVDNYKYPKGFSFNPKNTDHPDTMFYNERSEEEKERSILFLEELYPNRVSCVKNNRNGLEKDGDPWYDFFFSIKK